MAETRDIETETYDAIVQALLDNDAWTDQVEDANFIRYSSVTGTQNPEKNNRHDGDYPQAILYLSGGNDGLYTNEETFETHTPDGPNYWRERGELGFKVELTSQLLKVTEPSQLCAETRQALRLAGPRLGLDFVTQVTVRWETKRMTGEEDAGDNLVRWKSTVIILVKFDAEGRALRGD